MRVRSDPSLEAVSSVTWDYACHQAGLPLVELAAPAQGQQRGR